MPMAGSTSAARSAPDNGHFTNALAVVAPNGRFLTRSSAAPLRRRRSRPRLPRWAPASPSGHSIVPGRRNLLKLKRFRPSFPKADLPRRRTVRRHRKRGRTGGGVLRPHLRHLPAQRGQGLRRRLRQLSDAMPRAPKGQLRYAVPRRPARGRARESSSLRPLAFTDFQFSTEDLAGGSGTVLIKYDCLDPATGAGSTHWEYKGDVQLLDPSGTVIDRRSGNAHRRGDRSPTGLARIPGALRHAGRVVLLATAQPPDDRSGRNLCLGRRPGPLAPSRDGLRLSQLRQQDLQSAARGDGLAAPADPRSAHSAPADRSGRTCRRRPVAWEAGRRVAGLRIVLAGHRVRAITVTSKRFRTAFAIRLGSTEADLQRAYPQLLKAAKKLAKKTTRPYRVKHATFTVRRGRVVAIKLS